MKPKTSEIVNQIIDWADQSSGTILSRLYIESIVLYCSAREFKVDRDYIDILIDKFESESGYLLKAGDFISIFEYLKLK